MGLHGLAFVDAISASPTIRLNLNDGNVWRTLEFNAPPPRLRRAASQNMMTDGGTVSSSSYDMRTLTLRLQLISASQDVNATQAQLLARELDRADNFLKYHPDGATKPVFFRLFRSDMAALNDIAGQIAGREFTVELLAEPFALGIRETLGPYTVNNDPAAGSNGHYFDLTGVLGDVAAPCIIVNSGTHNRAGLLSVRQHGTPSDTGAFFFQQCESCTLGTDTTNPGGGPDAAMSGTGTNNFVRTSFATIATMASRVTKQFALTDAQGVAVAGRYRMVAIVRRSDATSVIRIRGAVVGAVTDTVGDAVTLPLTTSRQAVDLGIFQLAPEVKVGGAYNQYSLPTLNPGLYLDAARDSGAGTLDWDYFLLLPADEATTIFEGGGTSTDDMVIDALSEMIYLTENGVDPFLSTSSLTSGLTFDVSGGWISLLPNQTNRVFFATWANASPRLIVKGDVATINVHYWPRYLYIRPSAS